MKISSIVYLIALVVCSMFCGEARAEIDKSFETEHLREINSRRAAAGLNPIFFSETLSRAARIRAEELMSNMSHTRPDGTMCFTVLSEVSSYTFRSYAENIAAGPETALSAVTTFMNSELHRSNILSAEMTSVGLATFVVKPTDDNASGYRIYWVEMFADSAPDAVYVPSTGTGIKYGAGQMWKQGGGATGVNIVVSVPKDGLLGVSFDGAPLHTSNYAVVSADAPYVGTTSVTILKRYLDFIRAGTHTVAFSTSPDITASTTLTVISTENDRSDQIQTSGLSWRAGSDSDMTISVMNVDVDYLAAVVCDGITLTSSEYTVAQTGTGSTASGLSIKLSNTYLRSLNVGSHTIDLVFIDGFAETTFTVSPEGEYERGSSGGGCTIAPAFLVAAAHIIRRRNRGR